MYGAVRGSQPYDGRITVETLAALRSLDQAQARRPLIIGCWPAARSNPYQALLYGRSWQHGAAVVGLSSQQDIDTISTIVQGRARLALHLHWTREVLAGITDEVQAQGAIADFTARLDRFSAAGGTLIWTVHNLLPHDCALPHLEALLQREIAERAAIIHVLTRATTEAVADQFTIPASRALHIPHPNYISTYPDHVTREQARFDLGLDLDAMVFSTVGALQPYKGLPALLSAFRTIADSDARPHQLIVAGRPAADGSVDDVLADIAAHPRTVVRADRIPDVDMQRYLKAADVAVLPYERSLNSGALIMALGFGTPVVAPDTPATREVVRADHAELFRPGDPQSLLAAMRAARRLANPAARASARARAERFDPVALSEAFFSEVNERVL